MNSVRRHLRTGFSRLALVLLLAAATGCQSVNRLREAQDSFNQAASAENAARFNPADPMSREAMAQPVEGLASSQSGYASVLLSLSHLSDQDQSQLKKNQLWGSTLTLKALSEWRLGQWDQALATAREAAGLTNQLHPRDAATLQALPGLIQIDQAYARIFRDTLQTEVSRPSTNNAGVVTERRIITYDFRGAPATPQQAFQAVTNLLVGPAGAVARIQTVRTGVDSEHPIQSYLIQAQLTAFVNLKQAADRYRMGSVRETNPGAEAAARKQIEELQELVKKLNSEESAQKLVLYWNRLCSFAP